MSPWFLMVTFLCLPFVICLSMVLAYPIVSGWSFVLLWACKPVSAPLGEQLSSGTEHCGTAHLLGTDGE